MSRGHRTVIQHRGSASSVLAQALPPLLGAVLVLASQFANGQPVPKPAPPAIAAASTPARTDGVVRPGLASTGNRQTSKPAWPDLTPAQQQALKPLAANWGALGESHKRKWIALSHNYPSLAPAEQAKMHSRMAEWATLSPEQRTTARLNFSETKAMAPDEKSANWQAYQALSPEEKQKLAAKAPPKPTGASAVVSPVPAQKLAVVPVTRQQAAPAAKPASPHRPKEQAAAPTAPTAAAELPSAQKN